MYPRGEKCIKETIEMYSKGDEHLFERGYVCLCMFSIGDSDVSNRRERYLIENFCLTSRKF